MILGGILVLTGLGKPDLMYQLYKDLLLVYVCWQICKGAMVLGGSGVEIAQHFVG